MMGCVLVKKKMSLMHLLALWEFIKLKKKQKFTVLDKIKVN
jgi:hypothetical protein